MEQLLAAKLYIPPTRPELVPRPRLTERLNAGLHHKLTLISAPAGFGKTTLVSEWASGYNRPASGCDRPVAWLSLDAGDSHPARFLAYLVAALQSLAPRIAPAGDLGRDALSVLQSPQPPPAESILIALLNEISRLPDDFVLVLDDYHVIDSAAVDGALAFLLEHLPPHMHLVIATREDPDLPLARYRARGQLTELRVADLRFTPAEAAGFLNQAMGLSLSAEDIAALETRTEGWIAGLQLAAISMQGRTDTAGFIKSFTGGHHFVLDYLVEEVLSRQSENVQAFLLGTSILERLCGPLCDAVLYGVTGLHGDAAPHPASASGQATLEYLERANLFIVPLDNQRRWYRYHHLFADFLRQRLQQAARPPGAAPPTEGAASGGEAGSAIAEYHIRASRWFEDNGLELEAFQHAAAAHDIERAVRLMESRKLPKHYLGVVTAILDWLGSLPPAAMDARPLLWVRLATLSLVAGQTAGVEERLLSAEKALSTQQQDADLDAGSRDLVGQIAAARATLALTRYQPEIMIAQARRALEYLPADNLTFRFTASWALTAACLLLGDRAGAARAALESLAISRQSGDLFSLILATDNLGQVQELDNQLVLAAETYRSILPLYGDHPLPNAAEAYLGLARISYQWNDLEAAERYGLQSLHYARLYDRVIDRFIISEVFLARLKLARGDASGAAEQLAQAEESARQRNFLLRLPEIAAAQALALLQQGEPSAAVQLAEGLDLPMIRARVLLAHGDPAAALALLEPLRKQMEARGWADEQLKVMVLQATALYLNKEKPRAVQTLAGALALAEPGSYIRLFVDEGAPMARLLSAAAAEGIMPGYIDKLLAAFEAEAQARRDSPAPPPLQPLIEPLSPRELEILRLIAQGLSNREIGERLFLAIDTVKGHNRRIFDKLQVQRRTEAIARARRLGLI